MVFLISVEVTLLDWRFSVVRGVASPRRLLLVGGGLSFVGLVCPHMAWRLVGPDFRRLLPATVLVGAVLMLFADVISRTLLLPVEIPVGIVVAVIGAPYFLYLLAKS